MARTKQTARKHVGKAPRKSLGLVKKTTAPTGVVEPLARRWRPGTVALREIIKYQSRGKSATDLLLRKRPFGRLVREIARDGQPTGAEPIRFSPVALSALQHATENYAVELLAEAQDYALHAQREGLDVSDLQMAHWKTSTTPQQRNLATCPVHFKMPRKSTAPRRRRRRKAVSASVVKAAKPVVSGDTTAPAAPPSDDDDDDTYEDAAPTPAAVAAAE